MRRIWRTILLARMSALAVLLSASSPALAQRCAADLPFGFIPLRSQSPLQQLRFGLLHHNPWVAPRNDLCLYFEHTWKNMWLYEPGYYRIDAEVHEFSLRTCYGLGSGFEVSVEVPVRYASGGILDPMIEGFHDLMNIGNAGRDEYPQDQFWFAINPDGSEGNWRTAGSGPIGWELGNSVLAFTYEIPSDSLGHGRAAVTVNVKIPTATQVDFFGGQAIDVGVSLTMSRRFGPVTVSVSPGYVYYSDRRVLDIDLRRHHFSGLAAVEYHSPGSRHSFILQTLLESGIARNYLEFSDNTYELMFGYKRRLSDNLIMELGFLENLFFFNNSPDFGLHLGLLQRIAL